MELRRAVVDIQGFYIDSEFIVKEFTLLDLITDYAVHLHFKADRPFRCLSVQDQRSAKYLERNHHKLSYIGGWMDLSMGLNLLDDILSFYDEVYVKGSQKREFLESRPYYRFRCHRNLTVRDIASEFSEKAVEEDTKLTATSNPCWFHNDAPAVCSQNNAIILKNFLCNLHRRVI